MDPRRILFIAEGQLGDLLLLTPAIRAVRRAYAAATIAVLVLKRHAQNLRGRTAGVLPVGPLDRSADSVLATNRNVDELYELDRVALRNLHGFRRVKAELGIVQSLRRKHFDAVICTFPQDRFVLWAFFTGARVRVGQQRQPLRRLLTHRPDIQKADLGVLRYYGSLAGALGAPAADFGTEYSVPEGSRRRMGEILARLGIRSGEPVVVLHPGATGDYKIWPPERFASLARQLQTSGKARILVSCGAMDEPVVETLSDSLHASVPVIRTGESIADLAALLERSSLLISNDSGPRHLAVAVGVPTLALFRKHQQREWGSYPATPQCVILEGIDSCPACPADVCRDRLPSGEIYGAHCLRMVGVEEVVSAAEKMLARKIK